MCCVIPPMKKTAKFETVTPHLQRLYYALKSSRSPEAFDRWNKDHLLFRNRLDDISVVWGRMRSEFREWRTRDSELLRSSYQLGKPRTFQRQWALVWKLRVAMESFYVYADILLDRFVQMSQPIFPSRGIQFRSFGSFISSIRRAGSLEDPIRSYWSKFRSRLQRLEANGCFYRDKFIMHAQSPYQESMHFEPHRGLITIRRRRDLLDPRRESEAEELRKLLAHKISGLRGQLSAQ